MYRTLLIESDEEDEENVEILMPKYLGCPKIVQVIESSGLVIRPLSKLLYFKVPNRKSFPLNLNDGFESYIFRNKELHEHSFEKIEQFLMANNMNIPGSDNGAKLTFCTLKGILGDIMAIPYWNYQDWRISVTKFENVIYIKDYNNDRDGPHIVQSTYAAKFRQYCLADTPRSKPNTDKAINENEKSYCFYSTNLENFNLIYTGQIIGIASHKEIKDFTNMDIINKCHFIFTKLLPYHHNWRKDKRLLHLWLVTYLANITDVYLAFKDKMGYIQKFPKYIKVNDIPKDQKWKPEVCIGMLHKVLSIIKIKMFNVNCPYSVYEFAFNVEKKELKYRVHEGKTNYSFLSENFIDFVKRNK